MPVGAESARASGQAATLLGIVRYTRWPGKTRNPVLCVVGDGPAAAGLTAELGKAATAASSASGVPPKEPRWSFKAAATPAALAADCDAVVLAGGGDAEARALLIHVASRPVLTIGLAPTFCVAGGQFCLHRGAAGPRFTVNTEALARAGLVVNPMVLRMGRREEPR